MVILRLLTYKPVLVTSFLTLTCRTFTSLACCSSTASVRAVPKMVKESLSPSDPSSFSRPDLALVTNLFIALDVNFERKVLTGNVDLTVKRIDETVNEIILDAKGLNIKEIYETETKQKLNYSLSEQIGEFGSKLTVNLPPKDSTTCSVSVQYETNPDASGLQWLSPEQTAGKQYPFVFSQFQAIHARSVIPCQDTPAVKSKYTASISAPKDLTVVMSAILDHKEPLSDKTLFHFKQDIPVQSYLIAIAVGALESREIGPRSKVWAEKEIIEASEYEFANTEHQLKIAEEICGPYVWGIYDLLVLPPSFPFGGMENPCLTFVTPTLLAGDRSLANVIAHEISHSWTGNLVTNRNFEHIWLNEGFTVFLERKILGRLESKRLQDFSAYGGLVELRDAAGDRSLANVVAHEIAHSWTGNLVTNRNFEHFWLNEGFTVFLERKILGRLESKQLQDFEAYGGLSALREAVDVLGKDSPLTRLVVNLKGVHPDDAFSVVPYEKGQTFLRYLESIVGGPDQFEPFLRKYFNTYKYKSITTGDFKSFFETYFANTTAVKNVDWQTWLYEPGMPPIIPMYDMTLVEACQEFKQRFLDWNVTAPIPFSAEDVDSLIPEQKVQFLQLLLEEEPQPVEKLRALEELFKLDEVKNAEIKFRWLRIGLKARWEEKIQPTLDWVAEVGRMKYVRPLYRDLYNWEVSRARAIELYNKSKQNMMHVSSYTVAQDLRLVNP